MQARFENNKQEQTSSESSFEETSSECTSGSSSCMEEAEAEEAKKMARPPCDSMDSPQSPDPDVEHDIIKTKVVIEEKLEKELVNLLRNHELDESRVRDRFHYLSHKLPIPNYHMFCSEFIRLEQNNDLSEEMESLFELFEFNHDVWNMAQKRMFYMFICIRKREKLELFEAKRENEKIYY